MIQTVEQRSILVNSEHFHDDAEVENVLSQLVIPAVPGEYYVYSSKFTDERPMYVLMKCRANKSRSIRDAEDLGREVNLLFLFDDSTRAQVCAVREAHASGLLSDDVNVESFGETWIAHVEITVEDFYELRSRKDVGSLVEICQTACSKREVSIALYPKTIIAMMTDNGKYGMFLVKELTPTLIQIDACHILL